jgi:hypothetical protein
VVAPSSLKVLSISICRPDETCVTDTILFSDVLPFVLL